MIRFKSKITLLIFLISVIIILTFNSILLDKLLLLLVFVSCLLLGKKESSFINPFYLFSLTPLTLLIYFNVGSFYMVDLKHETYTLAILNMIAFIFALSFNNDYKKVLPYVGTNLSNDLILHSIILYILSLSANFIPFLSSVLWVFVVPAIICAMKSKNKIMIISMASLIVFSLIYGTSSKTGVLLYILTLLISYEKYYFKTANQKRRLFIYAIFGVFLMIFSFSFANKERGKYDSDDGLNYYSQQGIEWSLTSTAFLPYMYLTTGWSNLQYVTETQPKSTNGLWTIRPILGYLQLDDLFEKEYELVSYSTFNTFTFIVCAYKDFGFFGSVFMSLLLGYYVRKVYSKYKVSQSPFNVAIYACVSLAVLEMFFSNHFFMLSYPFTILIVMNMYVFLMGKRLL